MAEHARLSWGPSDAQSYPLTELDVLDLARAVDAEGYPGRGTLWALVQRFAWLRVRGEWKGSLSDFIRAYAQPLNPRWFPNGDLHKGWVTTLIKAGKTAAALHEERRARARIVKSGLGWHELAATSRRNVIAFLRGDASSPVPGAIHYWASRASDGMSDKAAAAANQQAKPGLQLRDYGFGFGIGRNVFFSVPGSEKVSVRALNAASLVPTRAAGGYGVVAAIVVMALGGFLWAMGR